MVTYLNKEYLTDYEFNENKEYDLMVKNVQKGKFLKFPPDNRFIKLKSPIAMTFGAALEGNLWSLIPFSGSLILTIPPIDQKTFEQVFFPTRKIGEVIDFIKETGRLK